MTNYYSNHTSEIVKKTINNLDDKFNDLKDSVYEQIKYALQYSLDNVSSNTADLIPGLENAIELVNYYQKQNKQ
tara:strand:+ start:7249 stop:7470 length:222 start_codon:yes stop_codon:yes gene_type:complete